jgi:hypothetical protein
MTPAGPVPEKPADAADRVRFRVGRNCSITDDQSSLIRTRSPPAISAISMLLQGRRTGEAVHAPIVPHPAASRDCEVELMDKASVWHRGPGQATKFVISTSKPESSMVA